MNERRTQTVRRKLNDMSYGFNDPNGQFSWSKFVGVWAQIMFLFQAGKHFEVLISHSDALWVVATVLIAPELLKKLMSIKAGTK